jgi:hypothetical protein
MKNALLVVISLLVAVSLAELFLSLSRSQPLQEPPGPRVPGNYIFSNYEFDQYQTNNQYGFRESFFRPLEHTRNVLLLGDSFVEGTGLTDKETFAWKLNMAYPLREYQFFNAGVGGTNLADYLNRYELIKRRVSVHFHKVLIFLYLGNDILDYDRLAEKQSDSKVQSASVVTTLKGAVSALWPNVYALIKRALTMSRKSVRWEGIQGIETYVRWFNANKEYLGRAAPLTDAEKAIMAARFNRIEPHVREALRRGQINPWVFMKYIVPHMGDFVFNLDSDRDRRRLDSSMRVLSLFIQHTEADNVAVVIIPSKIQVCDKVRRWVLNIQQDSADEDEFKDLLNINRHLLSWFQRTYPAVKVLDMTRALLEGDGCHFYYEFDGHFNPAGADLVKREILAHGF